METWVMDRDKGSGRLCHDLLDIYSSDGNIVVSIDEADYYDKSVARRRAFLIAAAPDLLEELESTTKTLQWLIDNLGLSQNSMGRITMAHNIGKNSRAIAKARGK